MFITFEGLDFSGKTTQANLLVARLRAGRSVRFIREPGGTRISERLREILLDRKNLELTETAELMLFSASRAQLVKEVILPALGQGETVICDRFFDSTTAYQGYGRGLDLAAIRHINAIATANTVPDLTIIVDIPVDEVERRKQRAGLSFDRMESSGRAFYERVRNGYLRIAADEPARIVIVDGTAPVSDVEQEIWRAVTSRDAVMSSQQT